MTHRFEGKVAIVTGGARGQGEQIVRTLAREGCSVVLGDVLDDQGKSVADDLGNSVVHTRLDVTTETDWAAAAALAMSTFGGLDVLVNNAGIYRRQRLQDETVTDLNEILAVNLHGPFLGIQAVIPAMRAPGRRLDRERIVARRNHFVPGTRRVQHVQVGTARTRRGPRRSSLRRRTFE